MHKDKFTFQTKRLIIQWAIFELVFWSLLFGFVELISWIDESSFNRFTFLKPNAAWWMLILPLYYGLQIYWISARNKSIAPWLGTKYNDYLFRPAPARNILWRVFLIRNIFVFTVFAIMQPAFGKQTLEVSASGVELVFALDISNSMNVKDIEGGISRLDLAKKTMQQIIGAAPIAKAGILVFAGSVYPHLPLTPDKRAAKIYTQQIETDIMSHQGTNIGLALLKAADFFSEEPYRRMVVLITDGEDHEGMINEGLEAIASINASLFVYGIGTKKGGLIPKNPNNKNLGYLKDKTGNPALSKLDESMIADIAMKAKGDFKILNASYPDISDVLTVINKKKATNTVALTFEIEASRYNWPLGIALIFALLFVIHELPLNWRKWRK
ncbi:MAG: VWA domain-containing protein [Crocinitomicaceae bacterium]|nr:VWA domain-containing protein [Crocinitomicaceae bacterium]